MFCFSLKTVRQRIWMIVVGLVLIFAVATIVNGASKNISVSAQDFLSGSTASDRIAFLQSFGWDVKEDPVSVADVVIPSVFGDVYENYNSIQIAQGFDLKEYAGRTVKKWVYAVENYPGYAQSEIYIRATVLVCNGRIIGGDICSVELDGFMHGFAYES
ncbi:MAG: DUF4830 domain-containing protein [Clostridia bacterium]|nr:DUF4830 domain-containing protein [Clostridia bacterium]